MERLIFWAVLGAAILGWLATVAGTGARSSANANARADSSRDFPSSLPFALFALSLGVMAFLVTLPERGALFNIAFSRGQGFGRGFTLGTVAALGGAWACGAFSRVAQDRDDALTRAPKASAPLWPVLASLSALSLFARATLADALGGFAGGHLVASLLLLSGATLRSHRVTTSLLASGALFAALMSGTVLLGTYRDFRTVGLAPGTWAAFALGVGLALAFVPLLGVALSQITPKEFGNRALGSSPTRWGALLLPIGVAVALSQRLVEETGAVTSVAIGLLVAVVAWCARDASATPSPQPVTSPAIASPLGALAVLSGLLGAFVALQGVGVGLMLLGFWPCVLFALQDDFDAPQATLSAPTLLQLGAFGVATVLYRGVQTRFGADLRGVALSDQYALWGFAAGAVAPSLLASLSTNATTPIPKLLRTLLALLVGVAIPLALFVLFGPKCALALVMGASVGALLKPSMEATSGALSAVWALFPVALVWQWTHRWMPLSELSKAEKSRALAFVIAAAIVLWLLSELLNREKRGASAQVAPQVAP